MAKGVPPSDSGSAPPPSAARHRWGTRLRKALIRPELASLTGVVAAFIFFSIATPLFLNTATFVPATSLAAQFGIVAIGVTLLMIGGQFDLSVGAIVGLTSWSVYLFGQQLALPPELAIIAGLAFGTGLGLINGLIVVRTGLASFIVTLATAMVYRGFLTMQTAGMPIVVDFPEQFSELLSGTNIAGYRMSVLWFILLAIVATFFLMRTTTGNWVFSMGQNAQAARSLGVPVGRTTVLLFAVSGFTSALAGVIMASQYGSVDAGRGIGWELYAIAITVIGGTLLTGGYGSVVGTVLGAFFYAIVQGGLILIGVQGYWVNILFGVVLILAVLLNRVMVQAMMRRPAEGDEEIDTRDPPTEPLPSPGAAP